MYPTNKQINAAIRKNLPFLPISLRGMTKKKIQLIVNKSLNHFVREARNLKLGKKMWKFTWVSIATAKKKKYKILHKLPTMEAFLSDLLERMNKVRPIKIVFCHTGGASYKYVARPKNLDWIVVPSIRRYTRLHHYYKTLFHEICHCLADRLTIADRLDDYNDEEITAETSAMIISLLLGMNAWKDSYKYIGDYLLNSGGYIIHKGRVEYIKKMVCLILQYVLKAK